MRRGNLTLGTMILTVKPGRGGEGSFVSRSNTYNCRTRERGEGSLFLGTMIVTVEPGRGEEGSFVSRTMILTVEPGRGSKSHLSRNNNSNCRTWER